MRVVGRVKATSRGPLKARVANISPPASDPSAVRAILSQGLGVLRDRHGIERAIRGLYPLASGNGATSDPALVGLMIAVAALQREESRGGHYRTDFPDTLPAARPDGSVVASGDVIATIDGPARRPAERRTDGAEFSLPSERRRHRDGVAGNGRARHQGAHRLHAQDDPRPAHS